MPNFYKTKCLSSPTLGMEHSTEILHLSLIFKFGKIKSPVSLAVQQYLYRGIQFLA